MLHYSLKEMRSIINFIIIKIILVKKKIKIITTFTFVTIKTLFIKIHNIITSKNILLYVIKKKIMC